ncbi:sulfurtransferase [Amycolatopsis sp. FBCC-B4732]|uniref:sulfurtransferase n=1 Tax=Amycolatopsis sp. FBCC-B4732 TaxID=3079339 RepID=UPI001FF3F532|nr:sulfurtransferase [Amycolatopsis sp. FBCC-B4732]UOX84949.1 sulfurtransferase [Amycolatopsis sp. FBCC-B4732]
MRPLISTTDLAAALAGPAAGRPVVLDVRWRLAGPPAAESYAAGHVPGAVFVDLDRVLAAEPGEGGRHPLPAPADLQRDLRAAGVRAGHPVVAYDDADGSVAARAWWLLRWAGHEEVAVLDGGYAAWSAEDHPVSTEEAHPEPGDLTVRPGAMPVLDADEAAALARDGLLLDARATPRYAGETEPVDPRAGHIPGAVNAPFAGHIAADGRWHTPADLAARFTDLGLRPGEPVAAYCGSGVTASSVVLALELAGHPGAGLYAGSWSHWSRNPDRPAATGPLPG